MDPEESQGVPTPGVDVNTLAPVADAEQKPTEAESPPAAADPGEKKEPKGFMKRIDELTRNWRSTERDRDYWREFAMQQQTARARQEPPKTLQDFGGDETKFNTYRDEQFAEAADKVIERKLSEAEAKRAEVERSKSFRAKEAKFAKTVEDYAEVAHYAPISTTVADLVKELEDGPAVAYFLGNNPEKAEELSAMPERQAALELGRIEVRLAAEREKLKAKKVSGAPPPTPKIEGSEPGLSISVNSPESDKLSTKEWVKAWEREHKRKK